MLTRRGFVRLGLGAGAGAMLGACRARAPVRASDSATRPRYYVLLLQGGGHDTLYTTDPKIARDVESWVGLPKENQISEGGGVRLGPAFAPLAPWSDRIALLNGVQVGTANHDIGYRQYVRMKTNVTAVTPGVLDIIGAARDEQPLGVVYLGASHGAQHTPRFFGTTSDEMTGNLFDRVADTSAADAERLAGLLRREASRLERSRAGAADAARTAENAREVAAFLERMPATTRFTPRRHGDDPDQQRIGDLLDRAAWLLENDLTACVFVDMIPAAWDSHTDNDWTQKAVNHALATRLADFFGQLSARRNRHGVLADQTVVIAGSELGRFPRINDTQGKDHLPQAGFLAFGRGIRPGRTHGSTDRRMSGQPISLATGEPERGGHLPYLDDIGTTLLRLADLDPSRYGYAGRELTFLLG